MVVTSWRDRAGTWFAGPAWSLPAYLAVALLLRLPAVWCAHGFDHVDQQYQYVDPAWHLATGQAWHVPWEWVDRVRSDVYPALLAGLFRLLAACGCSEPLATMRMVRAVHAVLSLLPLWLFWLAVVRWRPLSSPRLPLLLFAGSGLLVGGVQPNAPVAGAMLAVAAALAVAGPNRFVAFGGVLLGLAFCCRFQDAAFGVGIAAVLAWQRRWSALGWFAAGCLPGILLQGLRDVAAGDAFLGTPWRYVATNLGGAAAKWQTQPFWFYLLAGLVPVVALVPPCLRVAWRRLRAGATMLPAAAAAAAVHLALYSTIARKALRFEHGAFAMATAVIAVGLAVDGPRRRLHTGILLAVHAVLWLVVSCWFGNAGAVRLALWLHTQPDFDGRVVVVDGDATALGGFFHLRPPRDAVVGVARSELVARAGQLEAPWIVAVRTPLSPSELATLRCELVASFHGQFDLRAGDRRFAYRRRARRLTCRLPSSRPACRRPASLRPSWPARRLPPSCASC